jgi:hypothetical protein
MSGALPRVELFYVERASKYIVFKYDKIPPQH